MPSKLRFGIVPPPSAPVASSDSVLGLADECNGVRAGAEVFRSYPTQLPAVYNSRFQAGYAKLCDMPADVVFRLSSNHQTKQKFPIC